MKMLIPVCGDKIKIAKKVDLELKNIAQNTNFLKKYDEKLGNVQQIDKKKHYITLEKNTILTIDRVYVRQGDNAEYNSITFKVNNNKNLPNGRFFLPVNIVNELEIDFLGQEKEKALPLKNWLNKNIGNLDQLRKENLIENKYNYYIYLDLVKTFELLMKKIQDFIKEKEEITLTELESSLLMTNENREAYSQWKETIPQLRKDIIKLNKVKIYDVELLKINEEKLKNNHILKFNLKTNRIFNDLDNLINNYAWLYSQNKQGFESIYFNREISLFELLFKEETILKFVTGYNTSYEKTKFTHHGIIEYENMSTFAVLNPNKIGELNNILEFKDNEIKNLKEIKKELTKNKK